MNEHDDNEPTNEPITGSNSIEQTGDEASAAEPVETPLATTVMEDDREQPEAHDAESGAADVPPYDSSPPPPPPGPGMPGGTPPPPGPAPTATVPGLVRDPNATFGGVLSGIAHRYAWSLAAVRLAFVALLLISFGTAFLLYLAAWVIVPRATHWPPAVVRRKGERLSNRDLGLGVAGAGLVAFLVVGSNGAGSVLVPLLLIGAGIWLLVQPAREGEVATVTASDPSAQVPSFTTPPPVGEPVPPRRRRRWIIRILVATLVLGVLASGAIAAAIFRGGADGFNLTFGDDRLVLGNYVPDSVDELPNDIDARVGAVRIDLTEVPLSEFRELDEPFELDIELDDGVVDLTLPEDLDVSIEASVRRGDIDASDARLPGADITTRTLDLDVDDPDLIISIDVDDGDINVTTER